MTTSTATPAGVSTLDRLIQAWQAHFTAGGHAYAGRILVVDLADLVGETVVRACDAARYGCANVRLSATL